MLCCTAVMFIYPNISSLTFSPKASLWVYAQMAQICINIMLILWRSEAVTPTVPDISLAISFLISPWSCSPLGSYRYYNVGFNCVIFYALLWESSHLCVYSFATYGSIWTIFSHNLSGYTYVYVLVLIGYLAGLLWLLFPDRNLPRIWLLVLRPVSLSAPPARRKLWSSFLSIIVAI